MPVRGFEQRSRSLSTGPCRFRDVPREVADSHWRFSPTQTHPLTAFMRCRDRAVHALSRSRVFDLDVSLSTDSVIDATFATASGAIRSV